MYSKQFVVNSVVYAVYYEFCHIRLVVICILIIIERSVLAVDRRSRTREQKITSGRSPFALATVPSRRNSNFILRSSVNARASVRQCAHCQNTDALVDGSQL